MSDAEDESKMSSFSYTRFFLLACVATSAGSEVVTDALPETRPSTQPITESVTGVAPQVSAVARVYRQMEATTKKPVYVDPVLATMCKTASPEQIEAARKRSGPHTMSAVMIYMNPPAADAFWHKSAPYPVGSVVVKEKSGAGERSDAGVGGMIKRAPGYDAANGDWEYFYFEDPAKIDSGRIASCVQCHAGAAATDHVFGGWSKPEGD